MIAMLDNDFRFQVCREEKHRGELSVPLTNVLERVSFYTGCSISTCLRAEEEQIKPRKPRKKRSDAFVLDDFDRDVVRRTVKEMISKGKCVPTARSVLMEVKTKINFPRKLTFMKALLKEIGFTWRKCGTNRSVLMERNDVVVARTNFLRNIEKFRNEGRPIIYTDETYVHTTHCAKMCWQSKEIDLKIPFSRGERLIVVHAGWECGFINGASLLFKAGSASGDYHSEMNATNFNKWLNERLIPNLPAKSVLVVDNASYHNIQVDKRPTTATRKADIIAWMRRQNINYHPSMLKAELLETCKRHQTKPRYLLDETLEQHGHTCLRLPQYHAELNAIELIWANIKGKVSLNNVTYKYQDILKLTEYAIGSVTSEEWMACCLHVRDVEDSFRRDDPVMKHGIERFVIEVSDESDLGTDTASEDGSMTDTASQIESLTDTASGHSSEFSDTDSAFE